MKAKSDPEEAGPLRIFIVSYLYDPSVRAGMGGFQKVLELAEQFSRRHRVTLFLPAYSRRPTCLDCVWIPVVGLPLLRLLWFNGALIPALLLRAVAGRPDVIYLRIFNAVSLPLLARILGARLVVEINGNPLQYYRERSPSGARHVQQLVSWIVRQAARIVTLTEGLKSEAQADFGAEPSRVFVAPSGSNPKLFFPRSRAECRRELDVPPDALVALFTGTFFAYHGIDLLLDALRALDLPSLQLWLLGDGAMRTRWESRARELGLTNVRFTGQVDYARVPFFIGGADFCLAPFAPDRGEVSPLKVLDYLFCARPTVIAGIPSVQILLQEFPSLLSFTPGSLDSLTGAMRTMIGQRTRYEALAAADSDVARMRYSWDSIAQKIEKHCFPQSNDE